MNEQELDRAAVEGLVPEKGTGPATGSESRQSAQEVDLSNVDWSRAKYNPDKIPAFAQLKGTFQSKIDALEKQQQVLRQQAEQAARRAADLEAQYHQQRMQDMTEAEQTVYRAQLAEKRAAEREAAVAAREAALARERGLDELAREFEVPREAIADAEDPMDAAKKAHKWFRENAKTSVQQQAQALAERNLANQVDVGGGPPTEAANEIQRQYDQAMKEYDTSAALDMMAEALRKGVKLRF